MLESGQCPHPASLPSHFSHLIPNQWPAFLLPLCGPNPMPYSSYRNPLAPNSQPSCSFHGSYKNCILCLCPTQGDPLVDALRLNQDRGFILPSSEWLGLTEPCVQNENHVWLWKIGANKSMYTCVLWNLFHCLPMERGWVAQSVRVPQIPAQAEVISISLPAVVWISDSRQKVDWLYICRSVYWWGRSQTG